MKERRVAVRITLKIAPLPDWWGADQAWDEGGKRSVRELVMEDLVALIDDAVWKIEKVE